MKRILYIILCVALLACVATSCYTTYKCPAYSHYQEVPTVANDVL